MAAQTFASYKSGSGRSIATIKNCTKTFIACLAERLAGRPQVHARLDERALRRQDLPEPLLIRRAKDHLEHAAGSGRSIVIARESSSGMGRNYRAATPTRQRLTRFLRRLSSTLTGWTTTGSHGAISQRRPGMDVS